MFLSKLGYSELVQRIFEKITFFRVDPLLICHTPIVIRATRALFQQFDDEISLK